VCRRLVAFGSRDSMSRRGMTRRDDVRFVRRGLPYYRAHVLRTDVNAPLLTSPPPPARAPTLIFAPTSLQAPSIRSR